MVTVGIILSGNLIPLNSLCNKRHELAQNFLSLILINLE